MALIITPPPPIPLQKSQSSFILVLIDQLGGYIARLYLVQVNKVNTLYHLLCKGRRVDNVQFCRIHVHVPVYKY